jgi:hypothetical protein
MSHFIRRQTANPNALFRQRPNPNFRHHGFASLGEYVHPKLRPAIHINTVQKLIAYKFVRLSKMIEVVSYRFGSCVVYFPWATSGWAFAIFKPGKDVKQFITEEALRLERHFEDRDDVRFVKNIWNPRDPNTDYKYLAEHQRNILLVFGDNTTGKGYGGSAAVRDYPNAFGIPTGWSDNYGVWTGHAENAFKEQHYLEYDLEEFVEIQDSVQDDKHAELKELEAKLRQLDLDLTQRELALRKCETALSQRQARLERRSKKHKKDQNP